MLYPIGDNIYEIFDAISRLDVEWELDAYTRHIRAKETGRCPICELFDDSSQGNWQSALWRAHQWIPTLKLHSLAWDLIVEAADIPGARYRVELLKACKLLSQNNNA